jgi:hypothetical protein
MCVPTEDPYFSCVLVPILQIDLSVMSVYYRYKCVVSEFIILLGAGSYFSLYFVVQTYSHIEKCFKILNLCNIMSCTFYIICTFLYNKPLLRQFMKFYFSLM